MATKYRLTSNEALSTVDMISRMGFVSRASVCTCTVEARSVVRAESVNGMPRSHALPYLRN